ncbi:unnamed protein product, partial [marine sediment metagenome]
PDGWTEGLSDTQRYKCIGNAVTVNVVEFLGHMIKNSLLSRDTDRGISYDLDKFTPQSSEDSPDSVNTQSIEHKLDVNGQSDTNGAHNDAIATMGASPCPTDLSKNPARPQEEKNESITS